MDSPTANDDGNKAIMETEKGLTKFNEISVAETRHNIELFTPGFVENVKCTDMTVEDITDEHIDLTKRMLKFLSDVNGLGLAAPQIGKEKNFFVYWTERVEPRVIYNPQYFPDGGKARWAEQCMTYGQNPYYVKRWKRIRAVWYTFNPETKEFVKVAKNLRGIDAQVFQHETDHTRSKTIATIGVRAPMQTQEQSTA